MLIGLDYLYFSVRILKNFTSSLPDIVFPKTIYGFFNFKMIYIWFLYFLFVSQIKTTGYVINKKLTYDNR